MQNGKQCNTCCVKDREHVRLAKSSFYKSYNPKYKDGLLPMCKNCCKALSLDDAGENIDLSRFQIMLHQNDLPFIDKLYKAAVSQAERKYGDENGNAKGKSIVGLYLSKLSSLQQYRNLTWVDGDFDKVMIDPKMSKENVIHIADDISDNNLKSLTMFNTGLEFELMKAMLNLLKSQYRNLDFELLVFYVQNRIGQELCIAANDFDLHEEFKRDADKFLIQIKESQGKDEDIVFAADYADMYLQEEDGE